MNLMALMSNLGSIQEAAAPAMREIAETKALAGESVRLQRDILQAIHDQNDLLEGILECLTGPKTLPTHTQPRTLPPR